MLTYPQIQLIAQQCGIDAIGCAPARCMDDQIGFMNEWIRAGYHGAMDYLERNQDKRYDIRQLVPGAQTVVVILLTWEHSGHDYHRAVKSKLYQLEQALRDAAAAQGQGLQTYEGQHLFCDSAPVLEKRWAIEAGLGYIGKNHQLIHPQWGSWVHMGELVLNEAVADIPEVRVDASYYIPGGQCGACDVCIQACPQQALSGDWDARRCIAYTTHRCTLCQQECPCNERPKAE